MTAFHRWAPPLLSWALHQSGRGLGTEAIKRPGASTGRFLEGSTVNSRSQTVRTCGTPWCTNDFTSRAHQGTNHNPRNRIQSEQLGYNLMYSVWRYRRVEKNNSLN